MVPRYSFCRGLVPTNRVHTHNDSFTKYHKEQTFLRSRNTQQINQQSSYTANNQSQKLSRVTNTESRNTAGPADQLNKSYTANHMNKSFPAPQKSSSSNLSHEETNSMYNKNLISGKHVEKLSQSDISISKDINGQIVIQINKIEGHLNYSCAMPHKLLIKGQEEIMGTYYPDTSVAVTEPFYGPTVAEPRYHSQSQLNDSTSNYSYGAIFY